MAAHAGIAFAAQHQQQTRDWEEASNSLVVLAVNDEPALEALLAIAQTQHLPHSAFYEPDIGDQLTAIALFANEAIGRILDTLPLALRDPTDKRWQHELRLRRETCAA